MDVAHRCDALTSVDLSATQLVELGTEAFFHASTLASIHFPSTLTSIGASSFQYIFSPPPPLPALRFQRPGSYCVALEVADLSATAVSVIPTSAFKYCPKLTSSQFPPSLTHIQGSAFYHAFDLEGETSHIALDTCQVP